MSHGVVSVIPVDVDYVPDADAVQQALDAVRKFMGTNTETNTYICPQFFDPGENWERILCPFCNQELPLEWWQDAIREAFHQTAGGFTDLGCTVPCCERPSSLNDIRYEWPAGFARFAISCEDGMPPEPEELAQLEAILGCRLRVILAHY